MRLVRIIGFAVLALVGLIAFLGLGPEGEPWKDAHRAANLVLEDDEANAESAESAPQQQVVNGWTARNLLDLTLRAQANSAESDARAQTRLGSLVLLALLAICWGGATGGKKRQSGSATKQPDLPELSAP